MTERLLHWIKRIARINWLKTLYINFRILPFRKAIHLPFIVYGKLRIRSLKGYVCFSCPITFGLVSIGWDVDNMPIALLPTQILINGQLNIGGNVILNRGANLVVWKNATMNLGSDVMICSGVVLKSTNKITVGDHVMISSGCFIMDSSIHCIYDTDTLEVSSPFGEISISDNVWLNMHTSVIKWGGVPSGCVSTQYTCISKPISSEFTNCLLSGQPARIIKRNITQVHSFSTERLITQYFHKHPSNKKYQLNSSQISNENLCREITKI